MGGGTDFAFEFHFFLILRGTLARGARHSTDCWGPTLYGAYHFAKRVFPLRRGVSVAFACRLQSTSRCWKAQERKHNDSASLLSILDQDEGENHDALRDRISCRRRSGKTKVVFMQASRSVSVNKPSGGLGKASLTRCNLVHDLSSPSLIFTTPTWGDPTMS